MTDGIRRGCAEIFKGKAEGMRVRMKPRRVSFQVPFDLFFDGMAGAAPSTESAATNGPLVRALPVTGS